MDERKLQPMPNIEIVKLKDDIERYYIDTYEKLYWIVSERFKMQKEFNPEAEPIIDLTRLIIRISIYMRKSQIDITHCCFEGIANLGYETNLISDNIIHMLVQTPLRSVVKYKINFGLSIICNIDFQRTIFQHDVIFYATKFIGNACFKGSVFNQKIDISSIECIEISKNKNEIDLDICDDSYFLDYIDKKKNHINLNDKINFSDSIFNSDVYLNSIAVLKIDYPKDYFINEFNSLNNIIFDGSHFYKKIKINHVTIGEISMQNCHFEDAVHITNNKYNVLSSFDFSYSIINSTFIIDSGYIGSRDIDLIINGKKHEPIMLSKQISFSKSLITKDAFIFLRNINYGEGSKKQGCLNFEYANILGTVTIQDSKLDKIKLDKSTLIGDINIENVETDYDSRESIAKIKNEYLQRNDIVNLLFYKAKEMKYYSEHLDFKYKIITNIFRWFTKNWFYNTIGICFLPFLLLLSLLPFRSLEKVREYTLLYLNRISNSFGMSWGQGVLFTCVTAWIFFVLINTLGITSLPDKTSSPLFVWGWNGWSSFSGVWQNYLRMFYLTKFEDVFNTCIKLNALGETLFFVSKIFVSYGIYQTISAFRKYGK